MKAVLRTVTEGKQSYSCLMFVCPGCIEMVSGTGLHMLAVNNGPDFKLRPNWEFDGNLEKPTVSPSILTSYPHGTTKMICHSFLRDGVFLFLADCTHRFAGQQVPLPDLPDWFVKE